MKCVYDQKLEGITNIDQNLPIYQSKFKIIWESVAVDPNKLNDIQAEQMYRPENFQFQNQLIRVFMEIKSALGFMTSWVRTGSVETAANIIESSLNILMKTQVICNRRIDWFPNFHW